MDKIHNLKIEVTKKIGYPTCSSLACFCFGLTRRGDSDDKKDVPLVSVWLGEVADDNFDFLNFSAKRLLPASKERPAFRLFPVIRLPPPLVAEVLVFLPLVLLLKMPEEVVAALLVALETVLGEAFGDSLEEGDEECDLLAEPSFPDNSTINKFIKLFSAGVYW